ncbi:hypothetical protein C8Q77DRAFT_23448 [Trametes polyzona]|nr:hypothetical protein C8Q77DRAFT_23448 [Trametes polyzona]
MSTSVGQGNSPAPAVKPQDIAKWYPIDESLYSLGEDELAFMKKQTGIEDEEELRKHIISVTKEAYAVFPFPCIRRFNFLKLKLSRLPGYEQLVNLARIRENAIFLDMGCFLGNDARDAAAIGFSAKNIVATDLHSSFWDLGHKLFRSTPESFPATFVSGDAFNPAHLAVVPPTYGEEPEPVPVLSTLASLNPLHGRVSAIHASAFFHLFSEEQQTHLARALAGLLSPLPGSVILGAHAGAAEKHTQTHNAGPDKGGVTYSVFLHSPQSWTALWNGEVFEKDTVSVVTRLVEYPPVGGKGEMAYFLQWCVRRL